MKHSSCRVPNYIFVNKIDMYNNLNRKEYISLINSSVKYTYYNVIINIVKEKYSKFKIELFNKKINKIGYVDQSFYNKDIEIIIQNDMEITNFLQNIDLNELNMENYKSYIDTRKCC